MATQPSPRRRRIPEIGSFSWAPKRITMAVYASRLPENYWTFQSTMPKFTHHIFVCCNRRAEEHPRGCCDLHGSEQLRSAFKAEIACRGLTPRVRANKAGCLDQCELGPTVVIYPQQIWYGHVSVNDVPRIIEETIVRGKILSDLLIDNDWLNTKGRGPSDGST